jgi:hypothetical protein
LNKKDIWNLAEALLKVYPNLVKVPGCPAGLKPMTERLQALADEIV